MGIPSWAVPGAKVVCIGCQPHSHPHFDPQAGEIFTIEAVKRWNYIGVKLVEMTNPHCSGPWWDLARFRPLVSQYTEQHDVAKLKHLLTSKESADA